MGVKNLEREGEMGYHFLFLVFLISGSLLPSLGLAVAGQEALELVHLHEPPQAGVHVSVSHRELPMVASSVLSAESWLRAHVLAHYPSKHITAIVVGHSIDIPCGHGQEHLLTHSHAIKNLQRSLVRWGLVKDIKITISSNLCFKDKGVAKRMLYGRNHLPPVLVYTPPPLPPSVPLSFAPYSPPEVVPSIPPAAVPAISPAAMPASPPSVIPASPPAAVPTSPPDAMPTSPPEVTGGAAPQAMLPPCSAAPTVVLSPPPWSGEGGNEGGLWCMAKPTVPEDKLQEAMDYACGEGGADCQEIAPNGSCFYPDNIVSHASYAFNSYWQKTKRSGGSCNFGGRAVLTNSDPSYLQCRFVLS